ncbi:protein FREE1 [Sesamum alatum]|uniref:Protein FREE1 n=1 Tax=Sesamum alatum TaxID=300844 RepID=A0AAE2CC99_9LAMI|nr:protein FREE1 [Sesamum alatum]
MLLLDELSFKTVGNLGVDKISPTGIIVRRSSRPHASGGGQKEWIALLLRVWGNNFVLQIVGRLVAGNKRKNINLYENTSINPSDQVKGAEPSVEKKKGFIDWKNFIKPVNEEKDHWVPDEAVTKCTACGTDFSAFNREGKHSGSMDKLTVNICCAKTAGIFSVTNAHKAELHSLQMSMPNQFEFATDACILFAYKCNIDNTTSGQPTLNEAEVTQRLSNKVALGRVAGFQSHEELARKLQEELDKKRKTGANPEASGTKMREVVCPICTVHLQVWVPSSGSETIECSVCQHPFLVSAH